MGDLLGFVEGLARSRWQVRAVVCAAVFAVLGVTCARAVADPPLSLRAVRGDAKHQVRAACHAYDRTGTDGRIIYKWRVCHFVPGTRKKQVDIECVREMPVAKHNIFCSGQFFSMVRHRRGKPAPVDAKSLYCTGGAQYSGSGVSFRIVGGSWAPDRFVCTVIGFIAKASSPQRSSWSMLDRSSWSSVLADTAFSMTSARQAATALFPMTPLVRWHLGRGHMTGPASASFRFTWQVPANHMFCVGRVRVRLRGGGYVPKAVTTGCVA
jgi:hypothetical protein